MDKIKVIQAERLCYRGLLPPGHRFKMEEKLEEFRQERKEAEAREKMEAELYKEMLEDQGVT